MNDMAVSVGDNLKVDVMRIDDELLDVDPLITESFLGLVTRGMKGRFKARFIMRRTHPAATTACGRFHPHWVTDLFCNLDGVVLCLDYPVTPRRHRHTGFARKEARGVFVPHRLHRA